MKIDAVTHFTDEISAVEISTDREQLTIVLPTDLEVHLVIHHEERTFIHIAKKGIEPPVEW
jgi:hypothetical protein